jgi:hypothetical protein
VSKRRSQSPRQRKQGRNSTSPPPEASASMAPAAAESALEIAQTQSSPPSELDELEAGWDELLV